MWSFKFSDGYICDYEKSDHEEICFDIACQIRYHSWKWKDNIFAPIYPDVYMYKDGIMVEKVLGKELANEREIREYNKNREKYGLSTI